MLDSIDQIAVNTINLFCTTSDLRARNLLGRNSSTEASCNSLVIHIQKMKYKNSNDNSNDEDGICDSDHDYDNDDDDNNGDYDSDDDKKQVVFNAMTT